MAMFSSPASSTLVPHLSVRRRSFTREVVESFLLLAVTVLLFRTFAVEGYLISTGSMAPTLLGYHRHLECPACHFEFNRGAAFDKSEGTVQIASADLEPFPDVYAETICPNCSLSEINARVAPRNEGDQLLVQKLAYQFRDPLRWEVVVFENPNDADQAYVKRVVGLPGENVQLHDGNLFVNGELQRKPFEVQQAVRIVVSDYFHQPDDEDPDWRNRWVPEQLHSAWQQTGATLRFQPQDSQSETEWLRYENWIRSGGEHQTSIPVRTWPADVPLPNDPRLSLKEGMLTCIGTFSAYEKQKWLRKSDDADYRRLLNQLFSESHIAPVQDTYGYNSYSGRKSFDQHDFMVSLSLSELNGNGQFEIQLTDGAETFRLILLPQESTFILLRNNDSTPLWRVKHQHSFEEKGTLDFSLFDQQIIVAVDGQPIHPPTFYRSIYQRQPVRRPVRIGARNLSFEIDQLKLYRDVYYTSKAEAPKNRWRLAEDEFFVLGDNSPVSLDSRVWDHPAISRNSLIGKPFVVHLPSKQRQIRWKGKVSHVRVPDFSRIRYIR